MARSFPGGAAYLEAGATPGTNVIGTSLVVAAWVKPVSFGNRMVIARSGATASDVQWQLFVEGTGKAQLYVGDATSIDSVTAAAAMSLNVWHHVVGIKNGTGATALGVVVDGAATLAVSNRTIQNLAKSCVIGDRSTHDVPYVGAIGEVALWDNAAVFVGDDWPALMRGVSPLLLHRSSLRGYWPLWGTGNPEADLSGGGSPMAITGAVPAVDHPPMGMPLIMAGAG